VQIHKLQAEVDRAKNHLAPAQNPKHQNPQSRNASAGDTSTGEAALARQVSELEIQVSAQRQEAETLQRQVAEGRAEKLGFEERANVAEVMLASLMEQNRQV
jgi:hypothetical protein